MWYLYTDHATHFNNQTNGLHYYKLLDFVLFCMFVGERDIQRWCDIFNFVVCF